MALNNSTAMPGVYLDSHHGWYNHTRVIRELAEPEGFTTTAHDRRAMRLYDAARTGPSLNVVEHVIDLVDKATDHLNASLPDDFDYRWGWNDGDFGLFGDPENDPLVAA